MSLSAENTRLFDFYSYQLEQYPQDVAFGSQRGRELENVFYPRGH